MFMKNIVLFSALCTVTAHAADQADKLTTSGPIAIVQILYPIDLTIRDRDLRDYIHTETVTIPLQPSTTGNNIGNIIRSQKKVEGELGIPYDLNQTLPILQTHRNEPIKFTFFVRNSAKLNDTYTAE